MERKQHVPWKQNKAPSTTRHYQYQTMNQLNSSRTTLNYLFVIETKQGMADSPTPLTQVSPLPLSTSPSSSLNISHIQFVLSLAALISIPALIYLLVFAIRRSSNHPSFAGTRTTRASSSSFPSAGSCNFTCGGKIVSNDIRCFEDEEEANDHKCPVCLSGLGGGESVKQLSVCKHAFHESCIDTWLDSNGNTCPICRASIGHKKRAAKDPLPDASNMV